MGLFSRLFSRRGGADSPSTDSPSAEVEGSTSHKGSSSSKTKTSKSLKSKSNKTPAVSTPEQPITRSKNVEVAQALIDQYNSKDLNHEDFAKLWVCTKVARYHFEDGLSLKPGDLVDTLIMTRKCFPDFHCAYKDIKSDSDRTVSVEDAYCAGTHTGEPFSPAPGMPAIPAAGVAVKNDEERFCLELDENGKIKACRVISFGAMSGPLGFYQQIGGSA